MHMQALPNSTIMCNNNIIHYYFNPFHTCTLSPYLPRLPLPVAGFLATEATSSSESTNSSKGFLECGVDEEEDDEEDDDEVDGVECGRLLARTGVSKIESGIEPDASDARKAALASDSS